jgi:hypothetical protein
MQGIEVGFIGRLERHTREVEHAHDPIVGHQHDFRRDVPDVEGIASVVR